MVGCGPRYSGVLFFCSYFLLMALIMLKLFIAVILQSYNDIKIREERLFNSEMLEKFLDTWKEFDPDATGFIEKKDLRPFLTAMEGPLDFGNALLSDAERENLLASLGIKIHTYK
jgi:hypothetical protein